MQCYAQELKLRGDEKRCVWGGWCLSSKVAVAETLDGDLSAWGRQRVTGCLPACLGQPTTVGWILEFGEFYFGCSKYKSFFTGSAVSNLFLKGRWESNFKRFWTIENVLYYDHVSLFWESNLTIDINLHFLRYHWLLTVKSFARPYFLLESMNAAQ